MTQWAPIRFVGEVFQEFGEDGCDAMAGSMAFFTLFSLPPLLALIVDLAALVTEPGVVIDQLEVVIARLSGPEVAALAHDVLDAAHRVPPQNVAARVAGVALLLFTATVVLAQAQRALNRVWSVEPRRGLHGFLLKRAISLALVVGFVIALLASVGAGSALGFLGPRLHLVLPDEVSAGAVRGVTELVGFALLALFSTALHRFLPEARVPLSDVLAGGLVTAVLLEAGQVVISWIVATAGMGSVYGATQSLALLLFWVFYASALFLWGAEFIKVLARWRGHRVVVVAGARHTHPVPWHRAPDDEPELADPAAPG